MVPRLRSIDRPESLQDPIDKARTSLMRLESVPPSIIQDLEDALDKCDLEKVSWHQRLYVSAESWNEDVTVLIYLNVTSYTDVSPLLKQLAGEWKRKGDMIKNDDGFRWELYQGKHNIRLNIYGYVAEDEDGSLDGNVCRRVRTGTEIREYPTYEIICPEGN